MLVVIPKCLIFILTRYCEYTLQLIPLTMFLHNIIIIFKNMSKHDFFIYLFFIIRYYVYYVPRAVIRQLHACLKLK